MRPATECSAVLLAGWMLTNADSVCSIGRTIAQEEHVAKTFKKRDLVNGLRCNQIHTNYHGYLQTRTEWLPEHKSGHKILIINYLLIMYSPCIK